ncbi:DNA primase, partial [Streptomyces sp. A7024]|nr:DNA primase [Streptomyces coryli]
MNDTLGVNSATHVPSQSRPADPAGELSAAALFYAEEWHWQVSLGTWLEMSEDGARRCSCATDGCPTPGAHPARRNWKS